VTVLMKYSPEQSRHCARNTGISICRLGQVQMIAFREAVAVSFLVLGIIRINKKYV